MYLEKVKKLFNLLEKDSFRKRFILLKRNQQNIYNLTKVIDIQCRIWKFECKGIKFKVIETFISQI